MSTVVAEILLFWVLGGLCTEPMGFASFAFHPEDTVVAFTHCRAVPSSFGSFAFNSAAFLSSSGFGQLFGEQTSFKNESILAGCSREASRSYLAQHLTPALNSLQSWRRNAPSLCAENPRSSGCCAAAFLLENFSSGSGWRPRSLV